MIPSLSKYFYYFSALCISTLGSVAVKNSRWLWSHGVMPGAPNTFNLARLVRSLTLRSDLLTWSYCVWSRLKSLIALKRFCRPSGDLQCWEVFQIGLLVFLKKYS